MTEPATTPSKDLPPYFREAGDLWQRARTNALAHRRAAESAECRDVILSVFTAIFTVVPIVSVAISLQFLSGTQQPEAQLPWHLTFSKLAYIAIVANGMALLLGLLAKDFKFSEKASQHRSLLASYSIIAQKVRRIDSDSVTPDEAKNLLRHLQETFEIYKSSPFEPNDKRFKEAQEIFQKLKPHPFGLRP